MNASSVGDEPGRYFRRSAALPTRSMYAGHWAHFSGPVGAGFGVADGATLGLDEGDVPPLGLAEPPALPLGLAEVDGPADGSAVGDAGLHCGW